MGPQQHGQPQYPAAPQYPPAQPQQPGQQPSPDSNTSPGRSRCREPALGGGAAAGANHEAGEGRWTTA